jgi:predicted DNA-binding protein with PD1-like motif
MKYLLRRNVDLTSRRLCARSAGSATIGGAPAWLALCTSGVAIIFVQISLADVLPSLPRAHFTAVGAFSEIVLGFFDREQKKYQEIPILEQVEVLALTGNFTEEEGEHRLHAHAVTGKRDGSAHGGHLLRAKVFPTLEVVVTEAPAELRRIMDPETGIAPDWATQADLSSRA